MTEELKTVLSRPTKSITVFISPLTEMSLAALAKKTDKTKSDLIDQAIQEFLEKPENQAKIQPILEGLIRDE